MLDSAPVVPSPKATKNKAPAPKAAKAAPSHPTYSVMIKQALVELKERNGSSRSAINKYLTSNYKLGDSGNQINARIRAALKKGLAKGDLHQTKGNGASGSFKLPPKVAATAAAAPAATKPRAKKAASPKKTKKAVAPPKKTVASPKKATATKSKTTTKPKTKPAKKAKTAKKATKPKAPKAKKTTKA